MRTTAEMMADINSAMQRAKELSKADDVTLQRRKFYDMVSEPIELGAGCTNLNDVNRKIKHGIIDILIDIASNSNIVISTGFNSITVSSTTTHCILGIRMFKLTGDAGEDEKHAVRKTITVSRAVKHSKAITTVVKEFISFIKADKRLSKGVSFTEEQFTEEWLQYRIKRLLNEVKALSAKMYLYFTDNNYAEHYLALAEKESLHSCMAYKPSYYGGMLNGEYIHPLQGYDYAPDFRLGLVSEYAPDEIADATDYPFIARVVVSYVTAGGDTKLSYGKAYGNEKAYRLIDNCLYKNKPIGKQFYAVVADGLSPVSNGNTSTICDKLERYFDDGYMRYEGVDFEKGGEYNIEGILIAPFIDEWSNFFETESRVTTHPITGKKVALCTVLAHESSWDEGYDEYVYDEGFCMHHGTGVVRGLDKWEDYSSVVYIDKHGHVCEKGG